MNEDSGNLFDKLLDVVRKDRSKLDSVLSKHAGTRAELEPVIKTAMVIESVEQPRMSAKSRQDFRQRVLAMGAAGTTAAAGARAAAPRPKRAKARLIVFLSGCGSKPTLGQPTKAEIAAQEKVIQDYYENINKNKYKAAYDLTTANFKKGLSYPNFKFQYEAYINSVKVKAIARMERFSNKNNGVFNVTFDATYKQKYPYNNGELPSVHVVQREKGESNIWKIDSIGVGQNG